jgi:hypothetical protein
VTDDDVDTRGADLVDKCSSEGGHHLGGQLGSD